jgi:hypothetical protein
VLRLALAPGQHSLRVTFLNRVVGQLGTVHVDVQTGKVVPVEVKLAPIAGKVLIEYRPERYGATFRGRYGRGLNRTVEENSAFAVTATAGEPLPFAPKRLMPYAELPAATGP